MDISQKRLPVILIIALVGILVLEYVTSDQSGSTLIDSKTCELYVIDSKTNGKQFLNEFDSKCLDLKEIFP